MKTIIPRVLDFFSLYFGTKLQRTSSLVVMVGLGLVTVSYNEIIMKHVLEPAGFSVDGRKPVLVGFCLIIIGLLILILDKLAEHSKPVTFDQDKSLIDQVRETLPWNTLDSFLDNIFNLYYFGRQSSAVYDLRHFFDNEANKFENKKLNDKAEALKSSLCAISSYMGQNFLGPDAVGSDIFRWTIDRSVNENGEHTELYRQKLNELTSLRRKLETDYKALIEQARKLGMLSPMPNDT